MAWYDTATDKQLNLIKQIEHTCGVAFNGSNRQEASNFIAEWLPKKQFLDSLERALSIPVFSASKDYRQKVHGQWEEHYNNRNELNEEKLKGHMLRGDATPLDAFTEYIVGGIMRGES